MMKGILAVVAASVLLGIALGQLAGTLAGMGVSAAVAVIGSIVVVLRQNHRDRGELERSLAPVPVGRVVRDDRPVRGPR